MAGAADFFATLFLLSSHHLLSLALGIFKSFLLLKSLCFFLLCLFFPPFFPPLVNVFFQLIIQLALLGFIFGRSHDV